MSGPPLPDEMTCDNVGVIYFDNPFYGPPVPGANWGDITAYYCDPIYFRIFGLIHWGIDIGAPMGTPVVSTVHKATSATVIRAGYDEAMGFNVKICTDSGWCAIYMHMESIAVVVGEQVYRGTLLGWVDNTGFSTGPHLHYQINSPPGIPVDPAPFLFFDFDFDWDENEEQQ